MRLGRTTEPEAHGARRGGVRSLARGLQVLRAVNRSCGLATLGQISRLSGLPRPTTYRVLQTLVDEGYVQAVPPGNLYRATLAVSRLSAGVTPEVVAIDLGRSLVDAFTDAHGWPVGILGWDGDELVVRYSTHGRCPRTLLAPTRTIVHVPLLTTASGRVMTAMLPAVEREALLRRLGADRSARDLVEEAASLGYGASQSSVAPRMSGLAVVARGQGRPVVCISAMFIRSAVRLQEAIERYLPEIQEIAARIEAALGDQELPRAS